MNDSNLSMLTNYSQNNKNTLDPITQILLQTSQFQTDHLQDSRIPNEMNFYENENLQQLDIIQPQQRRYSTFIEDTEFPFEENQTRMNTISNETLQNLLNTNRAASNIPNINRNRNYVENTQPQTVNYLNQTNSQRTLSSQYFFKRLEELPIFRGESYSELRDFLDIADTLYVMIRNRTEKDEFYHQLLLRIRGEARNALVDLETTNWQTIRNQLREHFSYLANKDIINSKLENLRQQKNEPINTFADRARKLLREKNNIYMSLSEDQRLEHNRTARRAFAKGIADPRLRNRLLIRGANSLEDAIAYSIEAETNLLQEISNRELTCTFCKITGHRERDCRRKDQGNNNLHGLISALQALNMNNDNYGMSQNRQRQYNNNEYRPSSRTSNYNSNQRNDSYNARYYNNSPTNYNEYNQQRYQNSNPQRYGNQNEYRNENRYPNRYNNRNENYPNRYNNRNGNSPNRYNNRNENYANRYENRNENRTDSRNTNRNGNQENPSYPVRNLAYDADSDNSLDSIFHSQSEN